MTIETPASIHTRLSPLRANAFPPDSTPQQRRVLLTLSVLVLMAIARGAWELRNLSIQDFFVYYRAGKDLLAGDTIYAQQPGALPYTYPPLVSMVMVPLTWIPRPWVAALVVAGSAALCVWLMRRLFKAYGWLVVLIALCSAPMMRSIYLGQINPLVFTLLLADHLWLPARWRGYASGVAAGLKVTPAFMGLAFLLRRDWRAVLQMGVGFSVTLALTWLITPDDSWQYWRYLLWDPTRVGGISYLDNQSFTGALWRLAGENKPASWLVLGLSAIAVALCIVAGWRRWVHHHDALAVTTAVGLTSLLISPISWSHHWVWLLTLAAVLLREKRFGAALMVMAITMVEPLFLQFPYHHLPEGWAILAVFTCGFTAAALAGLGYLALSQPPTHQPEPEQPASSTAAVGQPPAHPEPEPTAH